MVSQIRRDADHELVMAEIEDSMEEKKFIEKEIEKKDFVHKDAIRAIECWFVHHTDTGGWSDEKVDYHLFVDGSISISNGNDFIHLSKEHVAVLRKLMG